MTANYQRASVEDNSLSSSVSKQLVSIGKAQSQHQTITASQNEVSPSFNQRAANVIKGLGR
jgi:hypothetical protein